MVISTFGAFMGAIGGLTVFKCVLHKEEKALKEKEMASIPQTTKSFFSLYKELFTYSIPFVVVGLAIPLYQTIDTFTINKLLIQMGYMQGEAEKINAIIGLVQMVVLIPVSVATAFSMSLVPEMTKKLIQQEM
ncbi:oligosaccharide flippase family protein [Bacillus pacificus]